MDKKETRGEQLSRVQIDYERLAAVPTKSMTAEQKKEHQAACQKLLAEKFRLRALRDKQNQLR